MKNELKEDQYKIVLEELEHELEITEDLLKQLDAECAKASMLIYYLESLKNVYYLKHRSIEEISNDQKTVKEKIEKIKLSIAYWKNNKFYIINDN